MVKTLAETLKMLRTLLRETLVKWGGGLCKTELLFVCPGKHIEEVGLTKHLWEWRSFAISLHLREMPVGWCYRNCSIGKDHKFGEPWICDGMWEMHKKGPHSNQMHVDGNKIRLEVQINEAKHFFLLTENRENVLNCLRQGWSAIFGHRKSSIRLLARANPLYKLSSNFHLMQEVVINFTDR